MSGYHVSSLFKLDFPMWQVRVGFLTYFTKEKVKTLKSDLPTICLFNRHLCPTYITCQL